MTRLKFLSHGVLAILFVGILTSCSSSKDIIYFQNTEAVSDTTYDDLSNFEIRIMSNDNLFIKVSALNPEAVEPFNTVDLSRGYSTNLELQGYLVDERGNINFPVIGEVHLAGLTKVEAIASLEKKISQYIDKPVVNIRFMNYKVAVLGEVVRPGTYAVDNERISIPEALAKAGDMTIYGQRHNILICRVENGEKKFYHVDITSPEIFFSEAYYLQQNDIVYVLPNNSRAMGANVNPLLSISLSVITLIVTVVNFATRF
jgi:polysaccharide export outer membrane protein